LLPKINPTLDETSGPDKIFLAELRAAVRARLEAGISSRQLAPSMHPRTVHNFAYGITARPSSLTVDILADSIGYEMIFVLKGTPDHQVSYADIRPDPYLA
jgi:hypothetical protein